jgi:hypothetical protein
MDSLSRLVASDVAHRAAIDPDHAAGHVARALGGEEAHHVGEFFDASVAARRDRRQHRFGDLFDGLALCLGVGRVQLPGAVGVDATGEHHVDGDPVLGDLAGQRLRPADDGRAQRVR